MTTFFQNLGMSYNGAWFTATISGILLIALPLMLSVAMIIYADRKIWAAMALRRGPNVVGPFGLLQSFADGLKVFLQETIIPSASNRGLFLIAPIITFTVALMAWAVIPFNSGAVLADINVGLLYILAISSLGVYGIVISGWASNSKYPFFSAMRAAAQMISYEVSIGFVLISVVLWAGTFNMGGIVEAQQGHVLGFVNAFGFNPLLFPIAVIFFISSLAETARAPFDLTEAESELVAGYQTEYSSMSFALFWLGEYANVLLMCTLNAVLFWGGYLPPVDWAPLYIVPGIIWLFAKILFFFFLMSWVKATVPRYRYDQLMRLGWKVFLPISLLWVVLVSGYLMLTRHSLQETNATNVVKLNANWECRFENTSGAVRHVKFTGTEPGVGSGTMNWSVVGPVDWMNRQVELNYEIGIGGSGTMQWVGKSGDKFSAVLSWYDEAPLENAAFGVEVKNLETGQTNVGPCRFVTDQPKQTSV